jgi:DNA-binding MarR family transcriptional regulator
MMIVRQVHREPGITVSEVARRCGVAKSHVSKTIEGLSRQGYVEKRPDPCDQRRVQLYLSQAVTDHLAHIEAMVRRLHAALVEAVPEEKREALLDGLRVLKTALEAARAERF